MNNLTYDYIKNLDPTKQHRFELYHIIGSLYCTFTYNENLNRMICLDVMEKGFTGECSYYNHHSKYQQNKFYMLNKRNFKGLMQLSYYIKQDIINNMNNDENKLVI